VHRKPLIGKLGIDGRITLKMGLREIGLEKVDRINLVQDRDQWQALVNTVMNLRAS
jgi:hypothetical protein